MKKISLIAVVALASSLSSFAQGVVNFNNSSGPLVSTNSTVDTHGNSLVGGSTGLVSGSGAAPQGYYYALLMQPYSGSGPTVTSTLDTLATSGWTWTGLTSNNSLGAGKIGGSTTAQTTAGDPTPVGGSPNQFIVVGWTANEGTTWAAFLSNLQNNTLVAGGFAGISMTGTGVSSTSPPEIIFGGSGITSAFTLNKIVSPVPEPGTMALAGLGIAGFLALRRKK